MAAHTTGLAPVQAPDQLWERIHQRPARRSVPRLAVATAAALLVVITLAYASKRPREIPRFAALPPGSCVQCHL